MDHLRYLCYLPLRRPRMLPVAARLFCMPVFSMVLHRHSAPIYFQALFFMLCASFPVSAGLFFVYRHSIAQNPYGYNRQIH